MSSDTKSGAGGGGDESVVVAVHVRPLIDLETEQGCKDCLQVTPGEPQVGNGPHRFTYDYVFGGDYGKHVDTLYSRCVAPLVDGLFVGYNATVFAYGQTGSGKTYTMGSAFPQDPNCTYRGVIPQAMESIFNRITETDNAEFTVRVGFVEIHKEDIRDLLTRRQTNSVQIRELPDGGITLAGQVEREVKNQEEMIDVLEYGTSLRATAETGMNKRSSRSHAIFTITVEQKKLRPEKPAKRPSADDEAEEEEEEEEEEYALDDYLCAKMHLVDLAGSERAKRTKAEGERLQEGININKGLLALGNVINALSESKPHVPYRDSKLTRMLQDSLGGNSKTLMIACASPADVNLEESLNTLRYAHRARAIKNKPVVNRDPTARRIADLQQQLAKAKGENKELRKRLGLTVEDEVEYLAEDGNSAELTRALKKSEARVATLKHQLMEARAEADLLREELKAANEAQLLAALQRDKVAAALTAAAGEEAAAAALKEAEVPPGEETAEKAMANKIHELEDEVRKLRVASVRAAPATPGSPSLLSSSGAALSPYSGISDDDADLDDEERAHRQEMDRVQTEMDLLQQQLESKEAAIAAVSGHSSLKESYENQLKTLASERDSLSKERTDLLSKIRALQAATHDERVKMERKYKDRIKELDTRVKGVDRQERKIRDLENAQKRALDSVQALKNDVQSIKEQKIALQRQAVKAAKEFTLWKRERDKEVMHLKKEGRANAAQLMRMQALHAKQLEVLRRKTEEASAARKRLQMLEGRRGRGGPAGSAGRPSAAGGILPSRTLSATSASMNSESGGDVPYSGSQGAVAATLADEPARREWVEAELDACNSSYELQRVLEGEKALRSEAARQLREVERRLAALKNPQWWGPARGGGTEREGSEEVLLKKRDRLAVSAEKHGRQIQEVQLALVQARVREEERGGGAADASRWSGVSESSEIRTMMTTLFRSASQYKAQAYEAQLALIEMSDEVEMLRLKLEVAEAEKLEVAMRAAEAQAAAEALADQVAQSVSDGDVHHVAHSVVSDAHDVEAASALHELEVAEHEAAEVSSAAAVSKPAPLRESMDESISKAEEGEQEKAAAAAEEEASANMDDALRELLQVAEAAAAAMAGYEIGAEVAGEPKTKEATDATPEAVEVASIVGEVEKAEVDEDEEEDYDDFDDDEDEEESSDEEADAWDPSQATPLVERAKARQRKKQTRTSSGPPAPPSMAEIAALEHLNAGKTARGEPLAVKLTVPELRAALKGTTTAQGEPWRGKGKKRRELLQDYLALMAQDGLKESGAEFIAGTPTSAAGVDANAPFSDVGGSVLEAPASGTLADLEASSSATPVKDGSVASPTRSEASDSGAGAQPANSAGSGSRRSPFTMKSLLRRNSSSLKSQNSGDQLATGSPTSADRQSGKSSGMSALRKLTSFGSGRANSFTSSKIPTPEPSRSAASETAMGSSMNGNGHNSREASVEVDAPSVHGSLPSVEEGVAEKGEENGGAENPLFVATFPMAESS